jgi:hypothetical protein
MISYQQLLGFTWDYQVPSLTATKIIGVRVKLIIYRNHKKYYQENDNHC